MANTPLTKQDMVDMMSAMEDRSKLNLSKALSEQQEKTAEYLEGMLARNNEMLRDEFKKDQDAMKARFVKMEEALGILQRNNANVPTGFEECMEDESMEQTSDGSVKGRRTRPRSMGPGRSSPSSTTASDFSDPAPASNAGYLNRGLAGAINDGIAKFRILKISIVDFEETEEGHGQSCPGQGQGVLWQ